MSKTQAIKTGLAVGIPTVALGVVFFFNADVISFAVLHPTQVRQLAVTYSKVHKDADDVITKTFAHEFVSPVPDDIKNPAETGLLKKP